MSFFLSPYNTITTATNLNFLFRIFMVLKNSILPTDHSNIIVNQHIFAHRRLFVDRFKSLEKDFDDRCFHLDF